MPLAVIYDSGKFEPVALNPTWEMILQESEPNGNWSSVREILGKCFQGTGARNVLNEQATFMFRQLTQKRLIIDWAVVT